MAKAKSNIPRTIDSRYQVLRALGEGGMGVVYKALDTSLERIVAIKFLSSQALPTTHDKSRFEREARAAASLNHPNVTTVFEYGEAEDPDSGRKISFRYPFSNIGHLSK